MKYYYNLGLFFEDVAKENKNNLALKYLSESFTYEQLNSKANIFSSFLLAQSYGPGDVVAIVNTKEFEAYAMMIACLKTGIAYTNIDVDIPEVRANNILDICKPKHLFCDNEDKEKFSKICKDRNLPFSSLKEILPINLKIQPTVSSNFPGDKVAYIMFTSGSTGIPKGVAITHQNIFPFIEWATTKFQITMNDVFANVSPMYFDNSVFDFFSAFFSGACLAPLKKEVVSSPKDLVTHLKELKCTIWFSVPSLLMYLMTVKAINRISFETIRTIVFGGEGYPKKELFKLYAELSDSTNLINVYGPTEGTCICSSYDITAETFKNLEGLPPLGLINPNFDFLILNENGIEDFEGELYITGPNIASGYYNDVERTEKSFTKITNAHHYNAHAYKTGDLVKKDNQGCLFFIGRMDNQIKHMGYRIELEEIELALNLLPEINQSAVIYHRERSTFGKIIAFYSANQSLENEDIRKRLEMKLPSYMIPNSFIALDVLPKNPNGKIDKQLLINTVAKPEQ